LSGNTKSFLEGGYYEIKISEKLSILALNSIYWNYENNIKIRTNETAEIQMNWLEEKLREN